jgi:hypothetical protein
MDVIGQQHAPSALSPVSTEQGAGWATSRLDALEVFGTGWKFFCCALLRSGTYDSLCIVPPSSGGAKCSKTFRAVFLNRRAAARYRALASIISGRENLSF